MSADSLQIGSLPELRAYVKETLCARERLERDAFAMTEEMLFRNRRPCGMFFCVHGPRAVRLPAIWETERNSLLFYDSTGQRFLTIRLAAAPEL